MSWKLQQAHYQQFKRNPLEAVIAQVRFHPILKVGNKIADFQDRVRERFPAFASTTVRTVQLGAHEVQIREEPQFQMRKPDEPTGIFLTQESLGLETRRHESRAAFLDDVELAVEALLEVYRPVAPVRLGLRYVNTIRLDAVSKDLARPVSWPDVLQKTFCEVPTRAR